MEAVAAEIAEDFKLTYEQIGHILEINLQSVDGIFVDHLGQKVAARFVPYFPFEVKK